MRTAKVIAILAVVLALMVSDHKGEALTTPVVVGDADFAGDVYEFRYYPKTANGLNVDPALQECVAAVQDALSKFEGEFPGTSTEKE